MRTAPKPDAIALPPDTLAAYLNSMRLRGATTASIYSRKCHLQRLAIALPVPLLAASHAELMAWRQQLRVSPRSINDAVSHARCFYAWATAEGLRDDNPCERIPVPRLGRRVPRPIGEPDLMAALEAAPPRIRLMIVLAAWCGLRAKELALLQRDRILDSAQPPVLLIAEDATKGHSERVIPLCPFAVAELGRYGLPRAGYVFARGDGLAGANQPWRISHLVNDYLHGLGSPATLHQLRHRFGTRAYGASKDLRLVQELMGHASPVTTAGYTLYDQASAAQAVAALPVPDCNPDRSQAARGTRRTTGAGFAARGPGPAAGVAVISAAPTPSVSVPQAARNRRV